MAHLTNKLLVPTLVESRLSKGGVGEFRQITIEQSKISPVTFNSKEEVSILLTNPETGASLKIYRAHSLERKIGVVVKDANGKVIFRRSYKKLSNLLKMYIQELNSRTTNSKFKFQLLAKKDSLQ